MGSIRKKYLKLFLWSSLLILVFSTLPLGVAKANVFGDILHTLENIPTFLTIGIPIGGLSLLAYQLTVAIGLIAAALTTVLGWVIEVTLKIAVVPGGSVTIVNQGWTLSRNLVDILFIVILAFIGFATILRLQNYQFQKILPALIIIALLVNFSGVLVGFVVDIANVITNFFVGQIKGFSLVFNLLGDTGKNLVTNVLNLTASPSEYVANVVAPLPQIIILFIFFLLLVLMLWVIMLLFVVRIVILWVLTILAPLAFAAYILPSTRKYWTQWWTQLIQWAMIGIPMTFFLWLAKLSAQVDSGIKEQFTGSPPGVLVGVFISLLSPITTLVILAIGFMLSMQLAPSGARGVINFGKKTGLAAGGWASREGWRNIMRGKDVEKLGANIRKRGQGIEVKADRQTRLEKIAGATIGKVPGAGFLGNVLLKKTGIARVVGRGIELGSKQANIRVRKRDEDAIARGEKEVTVKGGGISGVAKDLKLKPPYLHDLSVDVGRITGEVKKGNANGVIEAIKTGELDHDILQRLHKNTVTNGDDEARKILEIAFAGEELRNQVGETVKARDGSGNLIPEMVASKVLGPDGKPILIEKTDKDGKTVYKDRLLADEFAETTDRETRNAPDPNDRTGARFGRPSGLNRKDVEEGRYESLLEKILAKLTADDMKHVSKGMVDRTEFYEAINKFWSGNQVSQAASIFGREFINKLEESKKDADWYFEIQEKKDSKGDVYYTPRNPQMARYRASSSAQGLGVSPIQGLERTEDVNEQAAVANAWIPFLNPAKFPGLSNTYLKFNHALERKREFERQEKLGTWLPPQKKAMEDAIKKDHGDIKDELTTGASSTRETRTLWTQIGEKIKP